MPPIISDDELAPPMMAVAFHMPNFVTASDASQKIPKAIEFVVDYVHYPSLEKAFCDKKSLEKYGVMPSQKDNLTKEETKAIAEYMFTHFTQENLAQVQKSQAKYDALSDGEKLAIKYRCLGCHRKDKKIVGPSFNSIAKKYSDNNQQIISSIQNGSKGLWKESNGAVMPAFKDINDEELKELQNWIYEN